MVNKDLQSAKYLLNCNLLMSLGPHSPISVWPFLSLSSQHTAAYWVNAVRARCRIRGKQLFFFFFLLHHIFLLQGYVRGEGARDRHHCEGVQRGGCEGEAIVVRETR